MKLSVTLTTYNREDLLPQALDGLLAQRVPFDYEIVVGEDHSTDGTLAVVRDYERRHPGLFRVLAHERNLGLTGNFAAIYGECRGEFLATLDDDDLWLVDDKLARQVDFLERHPDCALSFHDSRHFLADGSAPDHFVQPPRADTRFELADLLPGPFIPTSSVVLRRAAVPRLPGWFTDLRGHDWGLHLLAAGKGWIHYLPEVWSATRIHDRGVWNGLTGIEQRLYFINDLRVLERRLPSMRNRWTSSNLVREYGDLAGELLRRGDRAGARRWAIRALLRRTLPVNLPLSRRLGLLAATLRPRRAAPG